MEISIHLATVMSGRSAAVRHGPTLEAPRQLTAEEVYAATVYRSLRAYELEVEQDRDAARDRWLVQGVTDQATILQSIVSGGGQGFLTSLRQSGSVNIPTSDHDLRGIPITQHPPGFSRIQTPADGLDGLDLTYANIQFVAFEEAFIASDVLHGTIANVAFRRCTFFTVRVAYCELINVTFEMCDFVRTHFLNCDMINVRVRDCYWNESSVEDCRCDDMSHVEQPAPIPRRQETPALTRVSSTDAGLQGAELASFYSRLSTSFRTGSAYRQARQAEFWSNQTIRRARTRRRDALVDLVIEAATGYGLRPLRVAFLLAVLVILSGTYFDWRLGSVNGWMVAAGAAFTFGAFTDLLKDHPGVDFAVYIATSIFGLGLLALLVSLIATNSLRDRG